MRAWIRRAAQAAGCAAAIGVGAGLASLGSVADATHAPAEQARVEESRSESVALVARRSSPPREPDLYDPPDLPLTPLTPFAEPLRDGRVITGATPHRMILFTFDDGPDLRNTPELLDTLDDLGVRAVFFFTASRLQGQGEWGARNRALARRIVARGHMIGNHTVDHPQLPLLSDEEVLAQVGDAEAIFEEVFGERTWLVRPPGGARSPRVDALLASRGYTQVHWNLGTGDFQVRDAEEVFRIFRRVLGRRERENGERGGIVLLHDTHEWSVEAVPLIVDWLRRRNCRLLAQEGEELFDIVDDPSLFFEPRGDAPGEESAVAGPATLAPEVLAERQRVVRARTRERCERVASR